ncbi:MAG: hypothetical protein ACR2OO_04030 [Thermomicrobiales bacterium]
MGRSRADARDYLAGTLTQLLADAGLPAVDAPGGLAEPIDEALLLTGTAYAGLATAVVADAAVIGFRRVLDYTGTKRIYTAVAHLVDITLGDPNVTKKRQQFVTNMKELVAETQVKAEQFIVVGVENSWQAPGSLPLDTYNTPDFTRREQWT